MNVRSWIVDITKGNVCCLYTSYRVKEDNLWGGGVTLAGGKYLLNAFSSSSHVAMLSDIIVSN